MFAAYLCHLWIEFGRISFSVATLCSVIDEMCAVERVHFIDAINKDVINHLLIRKYCPDSWGTIWMIRDDTMNQRFFDLRQDVSPESCYLLNKRIDAKISENDSVYKSKISFAVQLVDRYKDANKSVFLASMSLHHTILLQYSKIYGNINYVGSNFAADELFWKLPLSCILESFEQVDAFTELFSGWLEMESLMNDLYCLLLIFIKRF